MQATVLFTLSCGVAARSNLLSAGKGFLGSDLQPEVVAHSLLKVEDEWRAQAASFVNCNATLAATAEAADCSSATAAFQRSCATVADAVVRASSGDRSRVEEYMGIVCGKQELSGWHQGRCNELSSSILGIMGNDDYDNRENFDSAKLCLGFWSRFATEEKARLEEERAEQQAAEKKAEEERAAAEKKAEEERIEAEKKAAEQAAEEQKRREKEEAELKAEETKRQAEEAAAALKAKREEAERQAEEAKHQAEEAKRKMEEAQQAAEEAAKRHREMLAKASQNSSVVANVTNVTANATQNTSVVVARNASAPAAPVNGSK